MNKTFKEKNALGDAQREIELAAAHLQAKQEAAIKATNELAAADERYNKAVATLTTVFNSVRSATKVVPLNAR